MSADQRFQQAAQRLGHRFDGEIKIGGHYVPLVRHGDMVFVSGQIPRVGDTVVVTGRAGSAEVSLARAQEAAQICAMRALALLQRCLGSLEGVDRILRITVHVACTPDFTQHSEVADGASDLLCFVLGDGVGAHARTSVGAFQLPKNATVELELQAAVRAG